MASRRSKPTRASPAPAPTVQPEPSALAAAAAGLDPTTGRNVLEQVGPLVAFLVYITLAVLMAFEVFPDSGPILAIVALLGPAVGAWAAKLGILPDTDKPE